MNKYTVQTDKHKTESMNIDKKIIETDKQYIQYKKTDKNKAYRMTDKYYAD